MAMHRGLEALKLARDTTGSVARIGQMLWIVVPRLLRFFLIPFNTGLARPTKNVTVRSQGDIAFYAKMNPIPPPAASSFSLTAHCI